MGDTALSHELTREFERNWRRANPEGRVLIRDLAAFPIPEIDAAWIDANYTPKEKRTTAQSDLLALSTEFVRELLAADEYVIGVPIHNWGPSSCFKLWTDQIVRFGETMLITPSGLKGALERKRLTVFIAAGRRYGPGATDTAKNHLAPWLKTFFGDLGVREMRVVLVDGTADVRRGKISREAFLAPHFAAMRSLIEHTAGMQPPA